MPQFQPGEVKDAKATMRNPTGKAFDYTGFLYMGTDLAVMSEVSVHLNAGEEKQVSFPVTMPIAPGTYPVYIGVFSGGESIALYKAEDVVIVIAEFAYVSAIRQIPFESDPGQSWSHYEIRMEIDVKNTSSVAGVCKVQAQYLSVDGSWVNFPTPRPEWCKKEATIQPGQTVTFFDSMIRSTAYGIPTFPLWFTGDPGTTSSVNMI